jgi:hypothetical protein
MVSPDTAYSHAPIATDASQGRGAGSPITLRFDAADEPPTVKSVLAIPYEVWAPAGVPTRGGRIAMAMHGGRA